MSFKEFRDHRFNNYSDISEHLPYLEDLAGKVNHITEFGTRDACSTAAFIRGCKGTVVSYDINRTPAVEQLSSMELPCKWSFVQASTSDPNVEIEETEFLFIDTLHTFEQVESELNLHGHKAKKWIGFHDIASQGIYSVDVPGKEGINRAIKEYMERTGCWKKVYEVQFNNGLLVIERTGE